MQKAIAIFLILASLVSFVIAADVQVMVGNTTNGLSFTPQTVNAAVGDNIVFTWAGTVQHSVLQSDALASCTKSASATAFGSGGAFAAPHTYNVTVKAAGKQWFYCGVANHCTSGMYGTLIVGGGGAAANGTNSTEGGATATGTMPMPSGAMPSGSGSGTGPAASSPSSAANRNYAVGFVASSMFLAGSFML